MTSAKQIFLTLCCLFPLLTGPLLAADPENRKSDAPSNAEGARAFFHGSQSAPTPKGRCWRCWVGIGLGLVGGSLYFLHREDGPPGEETRGVPNVEAVQPAKEIKPQLLSADDHEVAFQFLLPNGKVPELSVFRKNRVQRWMASQFRSYAANAEGDPEKKKQWEQAPDGIQVRFEGMRFERVDDHPGQLAIVMQGNGAESKIALTIPENDLVSGKELSLVLPEQVFDLRGLGKAKVNGHMTIQYLPEKGVLFVKEAKFSLNAKVSAYSQSDEGGFKGLAGTVVIPAPAKNP